eukprot:6061129-Ditylum_brightwellii.AAC.1
MKFLCKHHQKLGSIMKGSCQLEVRDPIKQEAMNSVEKHQEKNPPRSRSTRMQARALKETRHYQQSSDLLLQKLPFQHLVREIAKNICQEQGIALK